MVDNQRTDVSGPATCPKPANTAATNQRERTETRSSAIAPQDISEDGGEPAHMPLCTIEAQIQAENLFVQQVVCCDACRTIRPLSPWPRNAPSKT